MAGRRLPIASRLAIAAAVGVVPTIVAHILLRSTGPIFATALWAALVSILIETRHHLSGPLRVAARWATRLLLLLASLVLIAGMVIVPLSAYLLWLDLFQTGASRGAVSFIFVMLVAYGSALYGGSVLRHPVNGTAAYVCWLAFLSIPLFQSAVSVLVLVSAALVLLATASGAARRAGETRRATLHAVVLLGVVAFLAISLGGAAAPRGSRLVDRVLSPRFRRIVVTAMPQFPLMYHVPGYGYRMPAEEVTSNPVLSNRAIFQISRVGSEPIYLRTEAFHRFTGSGWQISDTIRSAQPSDRQARGREPGLPISLGRSGGSELDAGQQTELTEIRVLAEYYPMIPHTLNTRAVTVTGRDRLALENAHESLGYSLREPLLEGDVVTLHQQPISRELEQWESVYLEVAQGTPEPIRDLAERLSGPTPQDSIINTLRFLRREFEYTLEPPIPQDPSEFLTAFLFDHQRGYCVQFATAFVVLSRLQGIPTRYVTGFLVQPPRIDDFLYELDLVDGMSPYIPSLEQDVIVTGYSAHAWAEVWLPDTGWRVVEATPPMQPYGYENLFFDRYESVRDEGRTFQQLAELMGVSAGDERTTPGASRSLPIPPRWLLGLPVLASLVFLAVRIRQPRDEAARFHRAVKHLRRRSARAGYLRPERHGWTRWAAPAGREGEEVAGIILSVFFGGRQPTSGDIGSVRAFTRERIAGRNGRRPLRGQATLRRRSPELVQD